MEALSFLKFWRPTNIAHKDNRILSGNGNVATEISNLVVESCDVLLKEEEEEEGDDSFFELELTVSDFDKKKNTSTSTTHNSIGTTTAAAAAAAAAARFDNSELQQQQEVHYNSSDVLSKRKIIPIEPTSKPQSPIALLKSAPKLRVSIFKKSKSMAATTLKTETQKHDNKLFTVKFKLEQEGPTTNNPSLFTRVCSLRKTKQQHSHGHRDDNESVQSYDSSSKRFSKDVIQKYLNLIKPLYVRVSKKNDNINNKATIPRYSGELTDASPAASPAMAPMQSPNQGKNITAGFRVVSRHLRKSKSSSSAVLSPARRDDSLLLQHDGIQSAILHCKRSFNSSRDSSSLSRSTSCSSQETFSNLSCKDYSLFSRFSSDSLSEESISARKSNEEGNVSLEIKREKAVCP